MCGESGEHYPELLPGHARAGDGNCRPLSYILQTLEHPATVECDARYLDRCEV